MLYISSNKKSHRKQKNSEGFEVDDTRLEAKKSNNSLF